MKSVQSKKTSQNKGIAEQKNGLSDNNPTKNSAISNKAEISEFDKIKANGIKNS